MLKFKIDKNKKIIDIKFNKEILYNKDYSTDNYLKVDHKEIAYKIYKNNYKTSSVIILCDRLKDNLYNNPKYMQKTNNIYISKIKQIVRKELNNNYFNNEQLKEIFNKEKYPKIKINYDVNKFDYNPIDLYDRNGIKLKIGIEYFQRINNKEYEENQKFVFDLEDKLFETQEMLKIADILEREKKYCIYGYDEETEEDFRIAFKEWDKYKKNNKNKKNNNEYREKWIEEYEKKLWDEKKWELFKPEIVSNYNRIYNMPNIFKHYDSRNIFQQWFLIEKEDGVDFCYGGSASSESRENMGRYAHTFAYLKDKYNIDTQTYITKYDQLNNFILLKKYNTFKIINRDLYGNYKANLEKTKKLFKSNLLSISRENNNWFINLNFE